MKVGHLSRWTHPRAITEFSILSPGKSIGGIKLQTQNPKKKSISRKEERRRRGRRWGLRFVALVLVHPRSREERKIDWPLNKLEQEPLKLPRKGN